MTQTTFTASPVPGQSGTASEGGPLRKDTKVAESAMTPGLVVVRGTDKDNQVDVPSGAGTLDETNVAGIVMLDSLRDDPAYEAGDKLSVMSQGRAWVEFEDSATAGDSVFIRVSGTGTVGAARTDGDTGNAIQLASAVVVRGNSGQGTVAEVAINLP